MLSPADSRQDSSTRSAPGDTKHQAFMYFVCVHYFRPKGEISGFSPAQSHEMSRLTFWWYILFSEMAGHPGNSSLPANRATRSGTSRRPTTSWTMRTGDTLASPPRRSKLVTSSGQVEYYQKNPQNSQKIYPKQNYSKYCMDCKSPNRLVIC